MLNARKRYIIVPVLIILFSSQLLSQDSITQGLEKPFVKKLINQQFGNLITPQSNNNIGNFASIDLKEAEVNFAGNMVFKNGSILGIKAKGGVSDGLLPIFSNTKLNTNFGIDVQYNFLDFAKKSIKYYNSSYAAVQNKIKLIKHEYDIRRIEIEREYKKTRLIIGIATEEKRIASLKRKLSTLSGL